MEDCNGEIPTRSMRKTKRDDNHLHNDNHGNINNCSRSPCMRSSRPRDIRVEYSTVSNTATVKETTSSQQIIYVYCSPKLKDAIVAVWKVTLFAYCIGVPIIVSILYRENEYNLERIMRLNNTLERHKMRNLTKPTSMRKPVRPERVEKLSTENSKKEDSVKDDLRFRRAALKHNETLSTVYNNSHPTLGDFRQISDIIMSRTTAAKSEYGDGEMTREHSPGRKSVDNSGFEYARDFDEICKTLTRVRRSSAGASDETSKELLLEKNVKKLRSTLDEYEERVKSVEQTYRWLKKQTWLSESKESENKIYQKCTCKNDKRYHDECNCAVLENVDLNAAKTAGQNGDSGSLETTEIDRSVEKHSQCACSTPARDRKTTYIRWGSVTCPLDNRTTSIYSGYMSGDGGTNYLCLPSEPKYLRRDAKPNKATGNIDGIKYGSANLLFGNNLKEKAVPCSMCHVTDVTSALMIPAATVCPDGWSVLYSGHVVALSGRKRSNYVCLQHDGDAKAIYGSRRIRTGSVEPVFAKCNILKCDEDNYNDNVELACVVCGRR